ncbi:hypothetical protein BH10PLA1_BH10PLA1_09840 [soil metagenome]
MPTYEYICDACGNEFEKFQSMTAPPVKVCPKCGKRKVRKLISAGAGLIFKGSGFYITDYRDGGYNEKAKADKDSGKAESKPADAKAGDAKPAEAKPSESKTGESKTGESKESKPAAEAPKPAAKAEAPAKPATARKDSSKSTKKR